MKNCNWCGGGGRWICLISIGRAHIFTQNTYFYTTVKFFVTIIQPFRKVKEKQASPFITKRTITSINAFFFDSLVEQNFVLNCYKHLEI